MEWRVVKNSCATLVAVLLSVSALSQNHYLVIGAFSTEKNDVKEITGFLPGNSVDTSYTVVTDKSTLQFYVMKSTDGDVVASKSLQLRNEVGTSALASARLNDTAESSTSGGIGSSASLAVKPRGKFFRFTITDAEGHNITSPLHQIDMKTGREIQKYQVDQYIDMERPVTNEPLQIACAPFGYKPTEKLIEYSSPWLTEGAYVDDRGAWVIPYVVEKLETGDVTPLYNVSFYKDANIVLPTSKKSLDELVKLLEEDKGYVITIHSHCNGKQARKAAIASGDNLFELSQSREMEVSAKELTRLRAEAIKKYLTSKGIDESRLKTYAWGATDMLVKPSDPGASINDRIEIEILKH